MCRHVLLFCFSIPNVHFKCQKLKSRQRSGSLRGVLGVVLVGWLGFLQPTEAKDASAQKATYGLPAEMDKLWPWSRIQQGKSTVPWALHLLYSLCFCPFLPTQVKSSAVRGQHVSPHLPLSWLTQGTCGHAVTGLATVSPPALRHSPTRVWQMAAEGHAAAEGEGRRRHTLLRRPSVHPWAGGCWGRAATGLICRSGTSLPAVSVLAFPLGSLWCRQHRLIHRSNLPEHYSPLSKYQT